MRTTDTPELYEDLREIAEGLPDNLPEARVEELIPVANYDDHELQNVSEVMAAAGRLITRLDRLQAIAEANPTQAFDHAHDEDTDAELSGKKPVRRFVTVTHEGTAECNYSDNCNVVTHDTLNDVKEQLAGELDEGWAPHGRVFDLDRDPEPGEEFNPHRGNVTYKVCILTDA